LKQARGEAEKSLGKGLESRTGEFSRLLGEAEAIGADITKARGMLGWTPRVPLEEGFLRMWDWYTERSLRP